MGGVDGRGQLLSYREQENRCAVMMETCEVEAS